MSDLETDVEAVEPCQFESEVYHAMLFYNGQRQEYISRKSVQLH